MTLNGYPELLSKSNLCQIYGISIWTLNRRISNGWGKRFEWYQDMQKIKATRRSVEAEIEKGIDRLSRRLQTPQGA